MKRRRGRNSNIGWGLKLIYFALSCSNTARVDSTSLKASAYYSPSRYYDRDGLARPEHLDFTKLTRVYYTSFDFNDEGRIWQGDLNDPQVLFGPVDWSPSGGANRHCHLSTHQMQPMCNFYKYDKGLIGRAHMNTVQVFASIGGIGSAETFSRIAASAEARKTFAQSCVALIKHYDFDGVDIDWRFPANPEDRTNFSTLLTDVRLSLQNVGKEKGLKLGLTATVPCRSEDREYIDVLSLDPVLSEFNVLTLDMHTPEDGTAGINAPLYDSSSKKAKGLSVDSCVRKYISRGANPRKLNAALPFYGHSFRGAQRVGDRCNLAWDGGCSDRTTWESDSPEYNEIYHQLPCMEQNLDRQTMTPLLSNELGMLSYDDPRSVCLKTEYAINMGLNGLVIFDLASDMLSDGSTPLLDAMNLKLLSPNGINCSGKEFGNLFAWRSVDESECVSPDPVTADFIVTLDSSTSTRGGTSGAEGQQLFFRYTCGHGEGDARDRCSEADQVDIPCDSGSCLSGMTCYPTWCKKPEFVKPRPAPKRSNIEEHSSELIIDEDTGGEMSYSCGPTYDVAKSCSLGSCDNGINDCPNGSFCFFLQCDHPKVHSFLLKFGGQDGVPAATTNRPSQGPSHQPSSSPAVTQVAMYHCGETRTVAKSCPLECGRAWSCPDGQDCYAVSCPLVPS